MRAREPDAEGYVDRGGIKLHYEVFGDGEPTRASLWLRAPARQEPVGG